MVTNVNSIENIQTKVSILVPIYKVEAFIEKCAISLFNQTYESIEYIFVNDCTPDNCMSILKDVIENYSHREHNVKIINHSENKGIGATRNTLLKAATGDYLMWVDSDDFIAENAVDILVQHTENGTIDIVTSDCYYMHKGENSIQLFSQKLPANSKKYIESLSLHQARAALWGTLSKKTLWSDNHIEILESSTFGEDYYVTVQLYFFSTKINVVQFPFYYYNQSNINSYTKGYKSESHFTSTNQLFCKLESFFVNQNVIEEYEQIIQNAQVSEYSGLLLHTTPTLRRRYDQVLNPVVLDKTYKEIGISKWQYFLLKLIITGRHTLSDIMLVFAKVIRQLFNIKF
jgi:glycosyltransferase involved in cell wall biosynthesis